MKIEIEKPVIPQSVADWIESLYDEGGSKYDAIGIMFEYSSKHDKPVHDWYVNNKSDFITAVMYGYEVEKEPLYYAKIKGWEILGKRSHWIYLKNLKEFTIGTSSASHMEIDVMTKEEWNDLGINDTNADLEEVGE